MKSTLRRYGPPIVVILAALLFRTYQNRLARQETEITSFDRFADIMQCFFYRDFYGIEDKITAAISHLETDDEMRIHLAGYLANTGTEQAEKAVAMLEEWQGSFSGRGECLRLTRLGQIAMARLNRLNNAEKYLNQAVIAAGPPEEALMSLCILYSGCRETFDLAAMSACVQQMAPESRDYFLSNAILAAASDETDAAMEWLDKFMAADEQVSLQTIASTGPVWGRLGQAEKVVEILEPYLMEFNVYKYSPDGFKQHCAWLRESPAYDSIRNDPVFLDLWARLEEYEPRPRELRRAD